MPVETRSLRDRSAVGRFPTVTLGFGEDTDEENEQPEGNNVQEENPCKLWLRKVCPCCRPKPEDDKTEPLVPGPEEPSKEDGIDNVTPVTDNNELDELLLRVLSIDLMKKTSGENRIEHHTNLYQSENLIVRRGQTFQMWITLSRPYDHKTDKLHLELKTGKLPTVSKGTHVIIPLVDELEDGRWEAVIERQDEKRLKLSVNSPPTACIGQYQLTVETTCANGQYISVHNPANDIFMLFNPWSEYDTAFLDSEEERHEYVLNDVGRIYYGTENQIGARTWNYGQFDNGVLPASLFVLHNSGTPPSGWGDPVNVVRIISAMINSPDDRGVLEGNWSGNYSGGTSPTVWSGSVEILKEYHKNNGTPVKYGQCWVFAGTVTTVLRCLGIPSRAVTNFCSAHDTDKSLTTDVFLDENLDPIDHLNTDSIWNFHVWTDCWMARADLPPGYGGWQAVDATPQETSQGTFCCGPASLVAVRNGQVYLKHDCPFVFAEVNSDKIYWQRNIDGTFSQIYSEKKKVGHKISTKAVGSEERSDITHLYKHPEGTDEERIAVETACRYGTKAEAYSSPTAEDVSVEVTMNGEGPTMGMDADLTITLRNSSSETRSINLHSQAEVMYYTGVHKATIRKDKTDIDLVPNEVKVLDWALEYKDYKDNLIDQAALMLTLSGRVRETQQVLATQFSFRLKTPNLILKPVGRAVVHEKMAVNISFTNPLPVLLKGVIFHLEGLGLVDGRKITYGDIGSHASVSLTEHIVPTLSGPRKLLASLDCRQITQVHGVTDITVNEKSAGATWN
ncbi:protein-glutamine gamma-glutamyltransferase K-like [Cynoglossus semilaevis]|uniref:Protein-glutamine gamma-glutamyltransferase K n=1 Tax=Cynoglossus semilaevis TaxID=244447 RepID=A0A3P8UUA6_CYNSE|nr:protein-glutamine gamma-glutamyltransferase K-like [Cynoglossus semilaevis]XP_008305376.1 protein-glutamine gamma-glutamyltransferase K-like [Cynoglossus semilaevis]